MTPLLAILLALASMGFWAWIVLSAVVFFVRLMNPTALLGASYLKISLVFFVPFIALVACAIMTKG